MTPTQDQARAYSRAELITDAAVHWIGLTLALASVPVLLTLAAVWGAGAAGITALSIYGVTLIAMIGCSLAYNHIHNPRWSDMLRRLDHSAIYLKIVGTYTPFALLSGAGFGLLAGLWGVAVAAVVSTFALPNRGLWFGIILCLAMGWAVLIGGWDLIAVLSPTVVGLMIAGGITYSLGTVFLVAARMPFHNTLWHVCVIAGSTVFFVAVMFQLVQTTQPA